MLKKLLGFSNIVLDLNTFLNFIIDLNIFEGLEKLLNFSSSLGRVLKVESLNHLSDITEPISIILINISFAPVAVSREVLCDFIHIIKAFLLIISPNLSLLVDQICKDKFGEIQDETDNIFLSCSLVSSIINDIF